MTGFLTSLVTMARGENLPGAARPSLPPRFAPSPAADFPQAMEMTSELRPDTDLSAVPAPGGTPERDQVEARASHAITPVAAAALHDPAFRSSIIVDDVVEAEARGRAQFAKPVPEANRGPVPSQRAPAFRPPIDGARSERTPSIAMTPPLQDHAPQPASKAAPRTRLGSLDVFEEYREQRAAPLDPAAIASRLVKTENASPPLYVTIDRIDVRAAVQAKPTPPPLRKRAAASVSLSDYLRGNGSGS